MGKASPKEREGLKLEFDAALGRTGIHVLEEGSRTPDSQGRIANCAVELPEFQIGSYFAPFQKYDPIKTRTQAWPDGCNRIQPLPIRDFRDLAVGGLFLLLQLKQGGYMAIATLVGPQTYAWFAEEEERLTVQAGIFGTGEVSGPVPLCAWATHEDPYEASRLVWHTAAEHVGYSTRMREEKQYPEIFKYLGWCSWEEYKFGISEDILLQAWEGIERSELPIRYFLVDDGHLHADAKRRLISFKPDADKFPNGWEPLMARKREDGIKWIGLWLNFNGYWNGIHPDNEFGELNAHLELVKESAMQPKERFLDSFAFYDAYIQSVREAGFDFIKVDNQAQNVRLNAGTDNGIRRAVNNAQALEAASARHTDGLINCMAHSAVCVFNTRISAVTRCSEDYAVGDLARARRHLHNSYGNIPWIGQTVWGDHDMFHSNDGVSGKVMAISKAMSGGPIYVSDSPANFVADNVMPLCYRDGELLRPLAPAAPLRESLFTDPFEGGEPYSVIAPLANESAAVVIYNLTEPEVTVRGALTAEHYAEAGCMLQKGETRWSLPAEGLIAYDWERGQAVRLAAGEEIRYELDAYGNILYLLTPIKNGWSVIGRTDKFLSPAAVHVIEASEEELIVQVKESGPFAVWNEKGSIQAEGVTFDSEDGQLWTADLPDNGGSLVLRIRRK